MGSIYLRQVDFHTPRTEEEIEEIRDFQHRHMVKSWVKRFLIFTVIVGIIIVFQLIARQTVPHMFGRQKTVERMLKICIYSYLGINIFSWSELWLESKVAFDIEKAKIAKLKVKKKMIIHHNSVMPEKIRFLVCEENGQFILDRVYVRGAISFSNIKEGQMIYVERIHDEGHYQYYYVA